MKTLALALLMCIAPVALKGMYLKQGMFFDREVIDRKNFKQRWKNRYSCAKSCFQTFEYRQPTINEPVIPTDPNNNDERQLPNT